MQKIESSLQNAIRQINEKHFNIELIVAYSGGVDSQVLLNSLAKLKQKKLNTQILLRSVMLIMG